MRNLIFSDYGIQIYECDGRYFVQYDDGEMVVHMHEEEISKEEVNKIMKSENDAYEVLLACQNKAKGQKTGK